jgi:hypothetical protein
MTKNRTIFLAFTGKPIKQNDDIFEIKNGYECWDLKRIHYDDFICKLIKKIPPINKNVIKNYKADVDNHEPFGITKKQYENCSWGLLIPDTLEDTITISYAETMFLINLYSPTFLYPLFYASDFGIERISHKKSILIFDHYQNQSDIFKTTEFVSFFKILLSQSQYGTWQLDRIQKWGKEDWRLFVAGLLYSGLKDYDNCKNSFGWQRESADMATILEALFTADDAKNEEVGYRLRKRIAVLLSWLYPNIEKEIKDLYSARSDFVHGSFFAKIKKENKYNNNNLPSPDFNLLYRQKEYVRLALVLYLYLSKIMKDDSTHKKVMDLLEEAIIDIELRKEIIEKISALFSLMPKIDFKVFG